MAGLSKEEINNILRQTNIVDIISSYLPLEKKGKNFFGMCPFHDDHNPSMSVSSEKGIYTCFVCHKTGNVFNFVQDYENISFYEAVKVIALKSGIEINADFKTTSKYDAYYDAYDLAIKFYQNHLRSKDGSVAKKYLLDRGLSEEIIDEFNIGLAPKNNNTLVKLFESKKLDESFLLSTGLINEGDSLYDIFRDRIIFPIHNNSGKAVGISARIYTDSNEAKYINTRETKVFKKGSILFNYHRAIKEAKKVGKVILVEGQMDAIRIYASGIKNVLATMGTALTNDHVMLLKKMGVDIILCMDSDDAGAKATLSNGELLSKVVPTYVVRLKGSKDPDEYILKNGVDAFLEAINNGISFFDYKLLTLKKNKNLTKEEDISKYINAVIKELNKSNDEILKNITINKLSEEYNIDKNILLNQLIEVKPVEVKPNIVKQKINKNIKLVRTIIYYMMAEEKYLLLYKNDLCFIPLEKYDIIANDILAFYIKFNYINIADFLTYEVDSEYYEDILSIVDENIKVDLNDEDFIGMINRAKIWTIDERIKELKNKLKNTIDINEKIRLSEEIAELKKRNVVFNEES